MSYCPNCCFLFRGPPPETCPKCLCDVRVAYEDKMRKAGGPADSFKEWMEENEGTVKEATSACADADMSLPPSQSCPDCGEPLRPTSDEGVSFDLLGREVSVSEVGVMSMVIRKRAITQVVAQFDGFVCPSGHHYYRDLRESVKEICPVCRGGMARFGTTIVTCKKCDINLTQDKFARLGAVELLADEGWRPLD